MRQPHPETLVVHNQPSIWGELNNPTSYTDLSNEALREKGRYWALMQYDPELSPRARADVDKIIGRICFELVMRQDEAAEGGC